MSDDSLICGVKTLKRVLEEAGCDKTPPTEDDNGAFIIEGVMNFGIGGNWPTIDENAMYFVNGEPRPLLPEVRAFVARENAAEADKYDHNA